MKTTFDAFTTAYIKAALWSSTDGDGERLGCKYSAADLADETRARMAADCARFQMEHGLDIEVGTRRRTFWGDYASAGHDFWLTRNGHGAGFWDGDWPEPAGERLTAASHAFGEFNLYVGDDGKIYATS